MMLARHESCKSATYSVRYEFYTETVNKQAYKSFKTLNYFHIYENLVMLKPNYS